MKSRFHHQHAADYMKAWNKLEKACGFKSLAEQIQIIQNARHSVEVGRVCRGGKDAGFTDTELAYIAACDEHLFARQNGTGGGSVDPTTRGQYVVEVDGDHADPVTPTPLEVMLRAMGG